MSDFVYYLWFDGQMLMMPFENEEEAIAYAERNAIEEYEIEPWDVD